MDWDNDEGGWVIRHTPDASAALRALAAGLAFSSAETVTNPAVAIQPNAGRLLFAHLPTGAVRATLPYMHRLSFKKRAALNGSSTCIRRYDPRWQAAGGADRKQSLGWKRRM